MGHSAQTLGRVLAGAEGGEAALLFPSGTAALGMALLACLDKRRKVLLPTNCYPAIIPALEVLRRVAAVDVAFYEPCSIADLKARMNEDTAAVLVETFASWTFERADLAAVSQACRRNGTRLIVDNTAATPLIEQPIAAGADLVVHSLAKYLSAGRAFGGVCIAAAGESAATLMRIRALGFLVEEFPAEVADETLREWETLAARVEAARAHTRRIIPELSPHRGIAECFFAGAQKTGNASGFPSLIGVRFGLPRSEVEARLRPSLPIEIGAGWGGPRSRILLVPQAYWHLRDEFEKGGMARLYVGSGGADGVLETVDRLFSS